MEGDGEPSHQRRYRRDGMIGERSEWLSVFAYRGPKGCYLGQKGVVGVPMAMTAICQ